MNKTTQKFAIAGAKVFTYREQEGSVVDYLPAGFYELAYHPFMGYYLEKRLTPLAIPERLYGNSLSRVARIWNTYQTYTGNFTVGLFGEKGAGKSLLAALMAQHCLSNNVPVVDVSKVFSTENSCLEFLDSLGECFIIFDEFLKKIESNLDDADKLDRDSNYSVRQSIEAEQNKLLTFFQGSSNIKRMMFLIDNSSSNLSSFFVSRPGRMHYIFNYSYIEADVVKDMAKDFNLSSDQTDQLVTYVSKSRVTFDSIQAIIKEWLLYPNEKLDDILNVLNVPKMRVEFIRKALLKKAEKNGVDLMKYVANELITGTSSYLEVKFSFPNPLSDKPNLTQEEYDAIRYSSSTLNEQNAAEQLYLAFTSYENYLENKDRKDVTCSVHLSYQNFAKYKADLSTYTVSDFNFSIEDLESETVTPFTFW